MKASYKLFRSPCSGRAFLFTPGPRIHRQISLRCGWQFIKINDFRCVSGPQVFFYNKEEITMEFFNSAIEVLQTLVVALGAGLGVWGGVNLLEGYGSDNPGSNAHVR